MPNSLNRRQIIKLGVATGLSLGTASLSLAADNANKQKPFRLGFVGTGARGTYLLQLALAAGVEVPAICDINPANLQQAIEIVGKARDGRKPEGYSQGPTDYRRMLKRDDLDAIVVGTGMQLHAQISIDAMRAGKHVLSEVSGAMTVDECIGLIKAERESGRMYMLAENCCYWYELMMVRNMIERGLFGDATYAECGYVHDCRYLEFTPEGELTWRGEMHRDWAGNNYPTHSLGPVAQCLGIGGNDRMVSLVSMASGSESHRAYIQKHFPDNNKLQAVNFKCADSVSTLIKTARGKLIDLRYDIVSSRPAEGPYHAVQGLYASYDSRLGHKIWIESRTKSHAWEPIQQYAAEFEHPLWTKWKQYAKDTGHGGGDFFVMHQFLAAMRGGGPSPIGAVEAASWSCILPLSHKSIIEGCTVQEIPDFSKV